MLTRRAVRFWGYDSAMEWSFYVSEAALRHIMPGIASGEDDLLRAFDANRPAIYAAATRAHRRERRGAYDLVPTDF